MVTTQAHEGIETVVELVQSFVEKFKILDILAVTTQAREGIETSKCKTGHTYEASNNSSPRGH